MPAKPTLPRKAKRLPKGTTRHDYEPEVFEAWQRDRWRQMQAVRRSRAKHRGWREATFFLSKEARDNLTRMAKATGLNKSQLLNQLLESLHEPSAKDTGPDVPAD